MAEPFVHYTEVLKWRTYQVRQVEMAQRVETARNIYTLCRLVMNLEISCFIHNTYPLSNVRHDDHDSYYLVRAATPSWQKLEIPKYIKFSSRGSIHERYTDQRQKLNHPLITVYTF